jgi:Predicted pPIWI-associating nuclease
VASHVTPLFAELDGLRKSLSTERGRQLQSASKKAALRSLVERYFREIHPELTKSGLVQSALGPVDAEMQTLLALCHKQGSVRTYKGLLQSIKRYLVEIDSGLVSANSAARVSERAPVDSRIVATLKDLLPGAALSFQQALTDLDREERLSWRGPATDLREALRETLDHLAPDKDVEAAAGYKQEAGTNGPTMKQKVRYVLRNRGKARAVSATTEDAATSVDEAIGSFVRSVYTRSSVSTHTPSDKSEVLRILDLVRVVLCELLEVR